MTSKITEPIQGWDQLRHTGLLLDGRRLYALADDMPEALEDHVKRRLRQRAAAALSSVDSSGTTSAMSYFINLVLEQVCGFDESSGSWQRGSQVPRTQGRRAVTGETIKPRHLWSGPQGASLPVFIDDAKRIGIGRGRRIVSQVLGWLRAGSEHLALITNGRQWRLVFAGLDYDASCEWDSELWFEEGELADQVTALRALLSPTLWTPRVKGDASPLLQAIRETRKGQADLSEVLGERVREAVEILVRSHGEALKVVAAGEDGVSAADIYRAACRLAMRAVIILFAESRDLLPRDNPVYFESYGLNGLFDQLERRDARGESMSDAFGAWPRVLSLFRLVYDGSHHPDLTVTAYGGELFRPGQSDPGDGVSRALHVFETACFAGEVVSDRSVYNILQRLTRTRSRIRHGRGSMWVTVPVDFSDLSSEYVGVVYEGLLDYELKLAPEDDPVVFLAVGDRPALPLSRLEGMDDKAIRGLFKKLKEDRSDPSDGIEEDLVGGVSEEEGDRPEGGAEYPRDNSDISHAYHTRAVEWARRAARVAGLAREPRGRINPERRLAHEQKLGETARKLVYQQVLPGEWYLARWGGTRKGSGSFYTRPGLAVPTVQRTLRPLAYNPSDSLPSAEASLARSAEWTPKLPEEILSVKACDPACGSGSFVLAALRFLSEALYASLRHHDRIVASGNQSLVWMLGMKSEGGDREQVSDEQIPCPPEHPDFESRLKARLRRHVVERCIYAVDLDPLAVELCRLSLWIETMDRELPFGFLDHKVKCGNALVGAWFDQFQHYPAMAWKNREGGDKAHCNGVHFPKNGRGEALKGFHKEWLTPGLKHFLDGPTLFQPDLLEAAATAHDDALGVLAYMHDLPIHDTVERANIYRNELLGSSEWESLRDAMDLWCACWFWPADEIEHAPLPTCFVEPSQKTRAIAKSVSARHRFFHWELEFPDVFDEEGAGFDAVVGNPPWDIAKPASMEFFSNIDPLYRSYGKQEALRKQTEYFEDAGVEREWLDYCSDFRARSNFVGSARNAFGDPERTQNSQDRIHLGKGNLALHSRWRDARRRSKCFADQQHPFRHQGSADLNLYKLFLEVAHALSRDGGRIGFLVPSGLYSDSGTGSLRTLFVKQCRWEWLFGFENRQRIFPIHRSQKFNPIIIQKGGATEAIQTAFMRRNLEDWERAEDLATPYTRAQVERFSPKSRAILEIQSQRDLETLEKIYANSVLLGDSAPDGWGTKYAREFDMTGDSALFPPRPKWEERGYRPDEYSRWLKGDWRPIEELWAELGVDPGRPEPAAIELEDLLFDTTAGPERRDAESRFVHGHLLKPGDVAQTDWAVRCAQPPYDRLPVSRAAIPPGIILSRDSTEWLGEFDVHDVALPLYEGRMIGQFDFSEKGWERGKGRSAKWRGIPWHSKQIEPQYLMGVDAFHGRIDSPYRPKLAHMSVGSATNARTAIGAVVVDAPGNHKAPMLYLSSVRKMLAFTSIFNSFVYDYLIRTRVAGMGVDYHVLEQTPLPRFQDSIGPLAALSRVAGGLCLTAQRIAPASLDLRCDKSGAPSESLPLAITMSERTRLRVLLDASVAVLFGLNYSDLRRILEDSDLPSAEIMSRQRTLNPKGFWRLERDLDPELRHTVLTLVAYKDLESKIHDASGNRDDGYRRFFEQNGGEGWLLPETLRLSDYDLGCDDRATCHQPVASRLGPRFYDWQLAQGSDDYLRELCIHARNLLGQLAYAQFVESLNQHHSVLGAPLDDLPYCSFSRTLADGVSMGDRADTGPGRFRGTGSLPRDPKVDGSPEQLDLLEPSQENLIEWTTAHPYDRPE